MAAVLSPVETERAEALPHTSLCGAGGMAADWSEIAAARPQRDWPEAPSAAQSTGQTRRPCTASPCLGAHCTHCSCRIEPE